MKGNRAGIRWRPRIRLRTFLVVFTLLSLWLGWRVREVRRIENSIKSIELLGGRFSYPGTSLKLNGRFPSVDSLEANHGAQRSLTEKIVFGYREEDLPYWVGFDLIAQLQGGVEAKQVDDQLVAVATTHLRCLPSVKHISLDNTGVSSESCRHLASVRHLRWASFDRTGLSDQDVDAIAGLAHLDFVSLAETEVSWNGGRELRKRMPDCRVVVFHPMKL